MTLLTWGFPLSFSPSSSSSSKSSLSTSFDVRPTTCSTREAVAKEAIDADHNGDFFIPLSSSSSSSFERRQVLSTLVWGGVMIGAPPSSPAGVPSATVTVRIESSSDPLGLEVTDTSLRGRPVIVVKRVVKSMKNNREIQPGMIVEGYTSSKQLSEKIKSGPYPVDIEFKNLAAGGDAFDDFGETIVTPQDAFELAKKTEEEENGPGGSGTTAPPPQRKQIQQPPQQKQGLEITTIRRPNGSSSEPCAMQTRRGDLIEINYEASYYVKKKKKKNRPRTDDNNSQNDPDDDNNGLDVVLYDSSAFRGTGRPFQLVLGTGDVIPGVDQGLYDMCPGEVRTLKIPPLLGYSSSGTQLFKIPPDYVGLEWTVELVSIEGFVRQDNNNLSRQERDDRS
eukprot:CAMPEP_0113501500 /NCGR_PEP_ID=MMETSP0014_2-20120614/32989_1 /TAXON_ID=2857 /ORGANISM="Nitzschia sp." /LENGTH=392 /DNA_ID=CAMNT_0000396095 /DNA_START=131 /DNA_END=1309 /DNA_ORIENTATION=+ /assembly_acc=CAM_ASM_000159